MSDEKRKKEVVEGNVEYTEYGEEVKPRERRRVRSEIKTDHSMRMHGRKGEKVRGKRRVMLKIQNMESRAKEEVGGG